MKGLKIEPIFRYQVYAKKFRENPIPSNQTDFLFFFEPILKYLNNLYWIIEKDSFQWPLAWHEQSPYNDKTDEYIEGPMKKISRLFTRIDENGTAIYALPDLMPQYAQYIKDDWNSLFGFKIGLSSPWQWLKRFDIENHEERTQWVEKTADICFLNVDGAYWEIHARDQGLIKKVKNHLKDVKGIEMTSQDLSTSYGI